MASAAAAVVAKARRDVISHFMQANAVSRDSAATWVPNRPLQQRMLEAEGVEFNERGRCDLQRYLWIPSERKARSKSPLKK